MKVRNIVEEYFKRHSIGTVHDIRRWAMSIYPASKIPPVRDITTFLTRSGYIRHGIKTIKGALSNYDIIIWKKPPGPK